MGSNTPNPNRPYLSPGYDKIPNPDPNITLLLLPKAWEALRGGIGAITMGQLSDGLGHSDSCDATKPLLPDIPADSPRPEDEANPEVGMPVASGIVWLVVRVGVGV